MRNRLLKFWKMRQCADLHADEYAYVYIVFYITVVGYLFVSDAFASNIFSV